MIDTESKPPRLCSATKPKIPLPKAPPLENELSRSVRILPSELLLKILEYYGGSFDQSCGSNSRKFIQKYFGKFTRSGQKDGTPQFLFRRLELDCTKMYHRSELLKIVQCLAANGLKVALKAPYVKLLYGTSTTDSQQAIAQTKKILKVLPVDHITTLKARMNQLPSEGFILCLEAMAPYLEDLTIFQATNNVNYTEDYDLEMFSKFKFPKLRIFRWTGNSLGKDGVKEEDIIDFSINCPSLTTLDIQTNSTSIYRFAKAIKNWPNLRTIKSILKGKNGGHIHGYNTLYDTPPEKLQKEFFENLSVSSKLVTISLNHEKIHPGMLKCLAGTSIKSVEITSCGIGEAFNELLAISSLKKLKLRTNETVHTASTDFSCDLVELNIWRTPIFTVDHLSKLKNLKSLTLIDQNINDYQVESFSREMKYLENVDLSENPITNASILSIARNCPKIVSICVTNTKISQMTLPKEIKHLIVK